MEKKQAIKNSIAKFGKFCSFRTKFGVVLSLGVMALYYLFVVLVGAAPDILGYKIGPSSVTVGILFGLFIIVTCIAATGLYTFIANKYFDKEQDRIIDQLKESGALDEMQQGGKK